MKEIKEALACWRDGNTELDSQKGLGVLIDLAERYLAVEAKMPEKVKEYESNDYCGADINSIIGECTLAVTKMLDRERIEKIIISKHIYTDGGNDTDRFVVVPYKELASAIIEGLTTYPIENEDIKNKYYELLFSVGNKYKGETRHETALKYIKRAEEVNGLTASQAVIEEPVKGKE